ncbi:MAG: SpoIIE family protein phosphatase, partial [Salinivirgaceae bacterium]|nr:SpoIIE family protein phosphatase [Salinivirgaceae bacterium]
SGALRPLFLCTQGDFLEIKGDKIPITSEIAGNVMAQYKEWDFDISKGDRFYMFTDGIIDQFGGNNNKKFLTKRFKQLILDAQSFSLDEQQRLVNKAIMDWRGEHDQIDDILVMGIEV